MLGNCCIFDSQSKKYNSLLIKRISINGIQRNLVAKFEVEQVFESNEEETKEVCYLFPNDFKFCIYDTTFMIGSEIIKPKIQPSQQARWIYKESIKRGYPVIMGTNLPEGLTLFNFGNLPANTECKVLLKIAFLCQLATPLSMFLKFPLKMYTPDGSKNWFHTPNLSFKLNCDNTQISDASCNLPFTYLQDECSIVLKENLRNDHELNDNNNGTSAIFTINLKILLIPMVMIAF